MTASVCRLRAGLSAGAYYTADNRREARPDRRDEYYAAQGDGVWWSPGGSIVSHDAKIDKESFRDLCAGLDPRSGKALVRRAKVAAIRQEADGQIQVAFDLEGDRRAVGPWASFAAVRRGDGRQPPRIVHAYAGTV